MAQADTALIIPRRNFLVRALGFTAVGATMAVPIITMDDAKARVEHHAKGLEGAMRDLYPGLEVQVDRTRHSPEEALNWKWAVRLKFSAAPPVPPEYRKYYSSWDGYDMAASTGRLPDLPEKPVYSSWREYDAAQTASKV